MNNKELDNFIIEEYVSAKEFIDDTMPNATTTLPTITNEWSTPVIMKMKEHARAMGEERWHKEHEKVSHRIVELKLELSKTIWTRRHMTLVALKEWEEGVAFPKMPKKNKENNLPKD